MLKFMLDTNTVIYVIKHRPVEVRDTFNENTGLMCISSITFLKGMEKGAQAEWSFPWLKIRTGKLVWPGGVCLVHFPEKIKDLFSNKIDKQWSN